MIYYITGTPDAAREIEKQIDYMQTEVPPVNNNTIERIRRLLDADAIVLPIDYRSDEVSTLELEIARQSGKEIYVFRSGWLKRND